jgi:chromosome segregation ATPase
VNKRLAARDTELQELNAQRTLLESEIGRLKEALREERECAENFGEIANERLDQLNKSRELHEEMEERYEEAKWHLGKAGYFERPVKRRKSLISSLLAATRAKSKANVTLKAGLDSLRRHKTRAQASEQELLKQIDQLKAAAGEARETIQRYHDATLTQKRISDSQLRIGELESRVNSQAEVINSLEEELKLSKVVQNDPSIKTAEAQSELTQRQQALGTPVSSSQSDRENDQLMTDALQREVAELRAQLAARTDTTEESAGSDEDRDNELNARLQQSETADSWKRKYGFLSNRHPGRLSDSGSGGKVIQP